MLENQSSQRQLSDFNNYFRSDFLTRNEQLKVISTVPSCQHIVCARAKVVWVKFPKHVLFGCRGYANDRPVRLTEHRHQMHKYGWCPNLKFVNGKFENNEKAWKKDVSFILQIKKERCSNYIDQFYWILPNYFIRSLKKFDWK